MSESTKNKKRWTIATVCVGLSLLVLVGIAYRTEIEELYLLNGLDQANDEDRDERFDRLREIGSARCVRPLLRHVTVDWQLPSKELLVLAVRIEHTVHELSRLLRYGTEEEKHRSAYVLGQVGALGQMGLLKVQPRQRHASWETLLDHWVACEDDALEKHLRRTLQEFGPVDHELLVRRQINAKSLRLRRLLLSLPRPQDAMDDYLHGQVVSAYLADHLDRYDLLQRLDHRARKHSTVLESPVIELLNREESSAIEKTAAISLCQKIAPSAVISAALNQRLMHDADPSVRLHAVSAMMSVVEIKPDPTAIAKAFNDESHGVVYSALLVARRTALTPDLIDGLVHHLSDPQLAQTASTALSSHGFEVAEHLAAHAGHPDSNTRSGILRTLTTVFRYDHAQPFPPSSTRVMDQVRQNLRDPDSQVRSAAASLYAQIGRGVDTDKVLTLIRSGELHERVALLPHAVQWHTKESWEIHRECALTDEPELRLLALKCWQETRIPAPLADVRKVVVKFDDRPTLLAAAEVLVLIAKRERPIPLLHNLLKREFVREMPRLDVVLAFLRTTHVLRDVSETRKRLVDRAKRVFPTQSVAIDEFATIP